jgi:hypothetical protein
MKIISKMLELALASLLYVVQKLITLIMFVLNIPMGILDMIIKTLAYIKVLLKEEYI